MPFTSAFHFAVPLQHTLRYDIELNLNFELIEAALLGFPHNSPPGSVDNYPDVIPSNGMKWLSLSDNTYRIYLDGTWKVLAILT